MLCQPTKAARRVPRPVVVGADGGARHVDGVDVDVADGGGGGLLVCIVSSGSVRYHSDYDNHHDYDHEDDD